MNDPKNVQTNTIISTKFTKLRCLQLEMEVITVTLQVYHTDSTYHNNSSTLKHSNFRDLSNPAIQLSKVTYKSDYFLK